MRVPTFYQARDSRLHGLHPLTKLALVLFVVTLAATLADVLQLLLIFVLLLVPLAGWGRVLGIFLRTCGALIWPFALSLVLIQGFFTGGPSVLLNLGPFTMTGEGVLSGLTFAARILVWLGAAVLLMITTRPDFLMLSLTELGLPRQIGYVVLTSLQIIPRFQLRAQTILDAQRSRGLETEGGLLTRTRALAPLVTPLVLSSIIELDQRAVALEVRAFNWPGRKTSLHELPDSRAQVVVRLLLLAGIPALIVGRILLSGLL